MKKHFPFYIKLIASLAVALSLAGFWQAQVSRQGSIKAGKIVQLASRVFEIPIIVDSGKETINAAEIYLEFDPKQLRVEGVGKEGSFFVLWIDGQPSFQNETGEIVFAGGLPTPGFRGKGQIGKITLTALNPGAPQLKFGAKTRALKNDGLGTSVPLKLAPITVR